MALPKSYLTSTKNLPAILQSVQQAKAPERFTTRFLEYLDFKSAADRLVIGVFKSLGLLDDQGRPTQRYFAFLDQTQSAGVLAEAIREAYSDIFAVNVNAQTLSKTELINKFKTLSQGAFSESVLDKMATTFLCLVKLADFSVSLRVRQEVEETIPDGEEYEEAGEGLNDTSLLTKQRPRRPETGMIRSLGGLHYNIQIILPETRDTQVYDALFRSLREHILG